MNAMIFGRVTLSGVATAAALLWLGPAPASALFDLDGIESKIGLEVLSQLKASARECRSAFVDQIDSAITGRLIEAGIIRNRPTVRIFHTGQVNAFALPGGVIVLSPALLNALERGDEYAGVFLHEIGHVVLGHHRKNMMVRAGISLFFGSEALELPGLLAKLRFSRDQEAEADAFAARAMNELGLAPVVFGQALVRVSGSNNVGEQSDLFSDHPSADSRMRALAGYQSNVRRSARRLELPAWRNIDIKCH
jgi:Zn-dependent protease with chaperone function